MMDFSPAGSVLMGGGTGQPLAQQVNDETEEERKKRQQELLAQRAGFSPAGRALAYSGTVLGL
jgi:hypothetical protein